MHFAKIPDEPIESMPVCYIKTDTTKIPGRESSSEVFKISLGGFPS